MQHSIGVFAMASGVSPVTIKQWKLLGYRGAKVAMKWSILQPTETDLSFTTAYNWIKLLVEAQLDINIQVWVGNFSPIGGVDNNNADWLRRKGVNIFYTTGHEMTGPWPNYYEDLY